MEIILACDALVVTEDASLGLPEVKIGLLPGAGGTQRLLRLISGANALTFMAKGDPMPGREPVKQGVADVVAGKADLIETAVGHARKLGKSGIKRRLSAARVPSDTRETFEAAGRNCPGPI